MAIVGHAPPPGATGSRPLCVRPPSPPVRFPAFEEVPESNRHLELRTLLYEVLKHELSTRATVGSNQFVYYDPTSAEKRLSPDAFVKLGEPYTALRFLETWQQGAPEIAVEMIDDMRDEEGWDEEPWAEEPWDSKLERYRAAGIEEVVRFDPDDVVRPVRVWDHVEGDLVERAPSNDGVFACTALGLYWVVLPHAAFDQVLRLARDQAGLDLVPTPVEAEARAREAAERAQQEEARAREAAERARHEAEGSRDALAIEVAELRRKLAEATSGAKAPAPPDKARAPRQTRRAKPPGIKK